ncbi:MAG TPA: hypothetical protein VGQ75_00220 [Thermoanaerobaculia bacterium]|jgi:hypothetical protein|nr:hypothetical protein [Thermoanaerobaculia bacterium]
MEEQRRTDEATERSVMEEMRELAQSFAALGRTAFKGGRVLSVELLRAIRGIVDRAREEIDRMAGEKK